MNPVFWLILLGGGAVVFDNLSKLNHTGDRMSVTLTKLQKIKIQGGALVLYFNAAVDNPTKESLQIIQPNLKAFINGEEVANSIPSGKLVDIVPNDRTPINDLNIQIPITNIPGAAASLLTTGKANTTVDIVISMTVKGINIDSKKSYKL